MNDFVILTTCLLDLLYELRETGIPLILGGGYGLYLKQRFQSREENTLLEELPGARSTNDLDVFLRTEVIADAHLRQGFRDALARLGYRPVPGAEYYQFFKSVALPAGSGEVKVDLLTGPLDPAVPEDLVRVDSRRVRPRVKGSGLHAHFTEEAVSFQEELTAVPVSGRRSNGEDYGATAFLPQTFTYVMMKLFAFRDKNASAADESLAEEIRAKALEDARKHALDLYTILAMTTEPEWETAKRLYARHRREAVVVQAGDIVSTNFAGMSQPGLIRLRENPTFSPEMQVRDFMEILSELFPGES